MRPPVSRYHIMHSSSKEKTASTGGCCCCCCVVVDVVVAAAAAGFEGFVDVGSERINIDGSVDLGTRPRVSCASVAESNSPPPEAFFCNETRRMIL